MTQNTNTKSDIARTVANLTALIRRTTGTVRDNHAHELSDHISIDLVAMLVAASDRYHAAERALNEAEATMSHAMSTALSHAMDVAHGEWTGRETALIAAVATAARTYVSAVHRGRDGERGMAQHLFIQATMDVSGMLSTADPGCAEASSLAWTAMSAAMAAETERATKRGYRAIQDAIQEEIRKDS